jgi:TRAP-type C4-dicarboxylate transport system substrate-binding protein
MSKGTIDGSYTPLEVLKGWKQAEVVKYVTNCYKMGYTTDFFIVMNKAKWDGLPGNIKDVFNKASEEWVERHDKVWSYYDKVAVDYFLTFPDRKIIELPENEMARWVAAAKPLVDGYIKDQTGKGLPMADYSKYLLEKIKDWSGKAPSAKDCVDWVEKNLQPK